MLWIGLLVCFVIMVAPIAIPLILSLFMDIGNESNSSLATLPWLMFYSVPLGIILAIIWTLVCWLR